MKKILAFLKKYYIWFIFVICLLIFFLLLDSVFENEIIKIDNIAHNFFVDTLRNELLTNIMKFITFFGSAITLIGICLLTSFLIKNKKISICVIVNLIIIALSNYILKIFVLRPRPTGYSLINESGYSFPSGHSMVSMAFYGYFIYLIVKYVKNKPLKIVSSVLLGILIILIGVSRIYLGVHYASDVIAGAVISFAYLICFIKITNNYILKTN